MIAGARPGLHGNYGLLGATVGKMTGSFRSRLEAPGSRLGARISMMHEAHGGRAGWRVAPRIRL